MQRYADDNVDRKDVLRVQYLKVVGSNPLHFGLMIQQLVHSAALAVEQLLKKKCPKIQAQNGDRQEFSGLVHLSGNGMT